MEEIEDVGNIPTKENLMLLTAKKLYDLTQQIENNVRDISVLTKYKEECKCINLLPITTDMHRVLIEIEKLPLVKEIIISEYKNYLHKENCKIKQEINKYTSHLNSLIQGE